MEAPTEAKITAQLNINKNARSDISTKILCGRAASGQLAGIQSWSSLSQTPCSGAHRRTGDLTEHIGQNPPVPIVFGFLWRVDTYLNFEFFFCAFLVHRAHGRPPAARERLGHAVDV